MLKESYALADIDGVLKVMRRYDDGSSCGSVIVAEHTFEVVLA